MPPEVWMCFRPGELVGVAGKCPANGWWPDNPNHPADAPFAPTDPLFNRFRGSTPLLGEYRSDDTHLIRQHAYWMASLGVTSVVLDWSNLHENFFCPDADTKLIQVTRKILEVYRSIREFSPPKVTVMFRQHPETDCRDAWTNVERMASQALQLYNDFPEQWYFLNDGSTMKAQPVVVIMPDQFATVPPVRPGTPLTQFNRRYTNGHLWYRCTAGTSCLPTPLGDAADSGVLPPQLPYWNYWENLAGRSPGSYRALYGGYRGRLEQSTIWVAVNQTQSDGTRIDEWDGMFHIIGGRWPIQRTADAVRANPPLVTLVQRFNYSTAWRAFPYEGLSHNNATVIEPTAPRANLGEGSEVSYYIFDATSDVLHSLRLLSKRAPGKPIVTGSNATTVSFSSDNFPTRVRTRFGTTVGQWVHFDVDAPSIARPSLGPFSIQTRNAFGESAWTDVP